MRWSASHRVFARRIIGAAIMLAATAGTASAADRWVKLDYVIIEPEEGKPTPAPKLVAAFESETAGMEAKAFKLKEPAAKPPVTVGAEELKTFKEQKNDKMAMVILVQGNYRWMGNEKYAEAEDGGGAVYHGAFDGVSAAIEALKEAGPPGSLGTVLVYADGVQIKAPWGPADQLSGSALGDQRSYSEYISWPLEAGLSKAISELQGKKNYRRVLVLIGDGTDNKDITESLRQITKDAENSGIEIFAIKYTNTEADPAAVANMRKLGKLGRYYEATSKDQIGAFADNAATFVAQSRYYITFPGEDFEHDGKEHELVLEVAGEEFESKTIVMCPAKAESGQDCFKAPEKGGSLWWLWLLIPLLLIAGIVFLFLKSRGAEEEEEIEHGEVEAPPVVDVPDPGPAKTVMLGMGGSDDSYPVVGWVVPMTGPNQYQTFKLRQGQTLIGTGGNAHVVVADGYMSTEHAEVVCTPSGFTLRDNGSTNGITVNSQRVSSHELVDNDTFCCGQTEFKFKSIT